MTKLKDAILNSLIERRDKVQNGGINCIPSPFPRFRQEFPGIEQGKYIIVTGATKSSKTQITNYLFVYNTVLYIYHHPGIIRAKICFFPLEETKENITLRFMAFLIHYVTNGRITISPTDLKSTDERKPVPQECLDIIENDPKFNAIFKIYEDIVTFYDSRHPTGIFMTMKNYAETHGHIQYRDLNFEEPDELTGEKKIVTRQVFDRYIPDDPDEYVIWIVDHVGLLSEEKDAPTKKQAIEKLSDYAVQIRNKYNYTYVEVQQQNMETTNLEAFKANKIRPTKDGLKESKRPGEDCDVLIGMTCPNAFDLAEYLKYDISILKDSFKLMEIVLNRGGRANVLCPLYHDGAINYYKEFPLPTESVQINKAYDFVKSKRTERMRAAMALVAWARKLFTKTTN